MDVDLQGNIAEIYNAEISRVPAQRRRLPTLDEYDGGMIGVEDE